ASIKSELRIEGQFQVEPKGAANKVQLHEVRGIGPPYDVWLPVSLSSLVPLSQPVPLRFTILEEKFFGRTIYTARFIPGSTLEASLESETVLPRLSNLRLEFESADGADLRGEIYAKVVGQTREGCGQAHIRYTSISPQLKPWLRRLAGPQAAQK